MTDVEQISKELQELKEKLDAIYAKNSGQLQNADLAALIKYLVDEREKTNRELQAVTEQVRKLEEIVASEPEPATVEEQEIAKAEEIPLSSVDTKVIEFVQTRGMASAAELQEFMHYKGKNAASARLNLLYKRGILDRFQMGHKVYYRYAGKANQILITPPQ
ncbi:MAG: hypothetical protein ACP5MC_01245 [Candidatus Micrarchaeia archaeon]